MKKILSSIFIVMFLMVNVAFAEQPFGTLKGASHSITRADGALFTGAGTVYAIFITVSVANEGIVLHDGYGNQTSYYILDPLNDSIYKPLELNFGRNGMKFTREPYITLVGGGGIEVLTVYTS